MFKEDYIKEQNPVILKNHVQLNLMKQKKSLKELRICIVIILFEIFKRYINSLNVLT